MCDKKSRRERNNIAIDRQPTMHTRVPPKKYYRYDSRKCVHVFFLWRITGHKLYDSQYTVDKLSRNEIRTRTQVRTPLYCVNWTLWNAKLPIIWCVNKYDIHRCSLICALRLKQRLKYRKNIISSSKNSSGPTRTTFRFSFCRLCWLYCVFFLIAVLLWVFGGNFGISWNRKEMRKNTHI